MAFQSQAPRERLLRSDEKSDKHPDKKWPWQIVIHLISLSWLAPIITLLYLNISVYIIGPSIWCPLGKCSVNDHDGSYSIERASRNDQRDHNMNGVLLFASKGLEVWFTFIAGLLVFEAQKALRQSKGGLPSGYSLTYLEFSDLLNLFDISKWTQPIREASRLPERRRQVFKLCSFALLAFLMTILVNLMGPATGVLILPSVQSIRRDLKTSEQFLQMQSHIPPTNSSGFPGCDPEDLENHRYACADHVQGPELDSVISFISSLLRNDEITGSQNESTRLPDSQEGDVRFVVFNHTSASKKDPGEDFTVPSRQTLRILSRDINDVINNAYGDDLLGRSLQVSSQREGPAILVSNLTFNYGAIHSIQLGDNKAVRCLDDYYMTSTPDDNTTYTKCIRVGTEWNKTNSKAGFSIGQLGGSNATHAEPEVVVYFSDKTTYYGGDLNRDEDTVACLNGTSSANCDWERIFSDSLHPSSDSTTVVEWFYPNDTDDNNSRAWFEFDSYLQFGVYSVDYSFGNKLFSAQLDGCKTVSKLVIDPLWMLAAWSVDIDGTVNATRFPAIMLQDFGPDVLNWTEEAIDEFISLNIFAMAQATSLISYDSSTVYGKAEGKVFDRWVIRRVWAYGLSSRTSRLGVVVVCLGMVAVVFRVIFAVCCCPGTRFRTAGSSSVFPTSTTPTTKRAFLNVDDESLLSKT